MQTNPDFDLEECTARARAGESAAMEALLTWLYAPVRQFALRRLTGRPRDARELAEDVTQETLLRVMNGLVGCRARSAAQVYAWVLAVARNVLVDRLRAERAHDGFARFGAEDDVVAVEAAMRRWQEDDARTSTPGGRLLARLLREALTTLPETTVEIMRLRILRQLSWAKVAREVALPDTAVKRRYQRAAGRLRKQVLAHVRRLPEGARELALARLQGREEA